jgi:hypothetical protein
MISSSSTMYLSNSNDPNSSPIWSKYFATHMLLNSGGLHIFLL